VIWYWRGTVLLIGAFACLWGLTKTYFEIKAWEVMVNSEQRAPEVRGDYRVYVKLYVFMAALGLTLILMGCIL
jgi:hypothetical protein